MYGQMRLLPITLLLLFVINGAGFNKASGDNKFGFQGGLNAPSMNISISSPNHQLDHSDMQVGYHFGAVKNTEKRKWGYSNALLFSHLSGNFDVTPEENSNIERISTQYSMNYLDYEATFNVILNAGSVDFYPGLGAFVGIGMFGEENREEWLASGDPENYSRDLGWGGEDGGEDGIALADAGVNAKIDMDFESFRLGGSYRFGFRDFPVKDENINLHHRVFRAYVGLWISELFDPRRRY